MVLVGCTKVPNMKNVPELCMTIVLVKKCVSQGIEEAVPITKSVLELGFSGLVLNMLE